MATAVDNIRTCFFIVNFVPERSATLGLGNPSVYYRVAKNGYRVQTNIPDQQRGCHNIPDSTSSNNLTERFLRWFRPVDCTGGIDGDREGIGENLRTQRRRSKSQPPQQHQQRLAQLVRMDPRFVQTPMEAPVNNIPKQIE